MRKFQLILAYYTLFASGGLFLWAIFLAPKPLGFLIAAVIVPIAVYFWIILLGRSKVKAVEYPKEAKSEEQLAKLALVILTTLLVSSVSMLTFSFINTKWLNPGNQVPSSVSSRLSLIEQEVEKMNEERNESTDKILDEIKEIKEVASENSESEDILTKADKEKLLGTTDTKLNGIT